MTSTPPSYLEMFCFLSVCWPGFLWSCIFTPFHSDGRRYLMIFSPLTVTAAHSVVFPVGGRRMWGSSTPVVFAVLTCDVPVCWSAPSRHCKWVLMIWVAVVELPVSLFNFANFFVLVVASSAEGLCYYIHVCLWMHWPSSL